MIDGLVLLFMLFILEKITYCNGGVSHQHHLASMRSQSSGFARVRFSITNGNRTADFMDIVFFLF